MQGIDNLPKGGGSSTLSGLSDVNFSSLTEGDLLIYDGAEWINHSFTEGHTILNESGSAVTARDNLQFTDGLKVTDDSGNNKTKVGVNTTFTEAVTRTNIASGDTFSTILGKIRKWFTDIPKMFLKLTGGTLTGALLTNATYELQISVTRNHSNTTSQPATVLIGNNTPDGTAGSTYGVLRLLGKGAYATDISAPDASGYGRSIKFPDASGTVALTNDLTNYVSKSGDTMSGQLEIKTSGQIPLVLDRSHTSTTSQRVAFDVGNNIANGTAGSTYGEFALYGKRAYYTTLGAQNSTANRTIGFPDKDGTVALTSDVPSLSVQTIIISINALSPLGESYDQDFSWSATYNIMSIAGYQLAGNNYTRCCFNRLSFRNGASKHVYYSIKNTSTTDTTGTLTLTVQLLVMAN